MSSLTSPLVELLSSDDEGLARAARQDPAAFAELYHRHFTRVYRYHIARTGNIADAQDLTTLTFLAAMDGISGYRGRGSFGAWLMSIAHNQMAQLFRSRRRERPLERAEHLSDPAPLPEVIAGRRIQFAQVSQALRELKPERAEAIVLCLFANLTAREAGQAMEKSEAAVKMLLLRGLGELREKLSVAQVEEV
jgi:RNA polymerase sigma-70 factor (ECF subfamily)